MKRTFEVSVVLVLTFALAGCSSDFDHVELVPESGEPVGASVTGTSVELPEGATFVVDATVMSATGVITTDFSFDLVSANPNVLGIQPVLGRPAGVASFVVFGVSEGTTQIQVLYDGQSETPIAASVTAPTP